MGSEWERQLPYDFAAIAMSRRDFGGQQVAISEKLGGFPVTMLGAGANRSVRSLGYPADKPFDYYRPRLFECVAPSFLGDKRYPQYPSAELSIGCDMTGGSSGGPWLADTDGDGVEEIVSVNSNGPVQIMFGPNLNGRDHWPYFDAARKWSG